VSLWAFAYNSTAIPCHRALPPSWQHTWGLGRGQARKKAELVACTVFVTSILVLWADRSRFKTDKSGEQAAFYYVGACAPKGATNMEAAAGLMLDLGAKTKVYMINKAAYGSAAEAEDAAKAAVGQSGSAGALGLKVITAGSADQAGIDKMAQTLTSAVSGKVKQNDAVLKAGPPLPPPPAKK
jgi:hypothetical protein